MLHKLLLLSLLTLSFATHTHAAGKSSDGKCLHFGDPTDKLNVAELKKAGWWIEVTDEQVKKGIEYARAYNNGELKDSRHLPGKIVAEYLPKFNTVIFYPSSGLIVEDSNKMIAWGHGTGGATSSALSLRDPMHTLGTPGGGKKGSTKKFLYSQEDLQEISNIEDLREKPIFSQFAFNLPFAKNGPDPKDFQSIEKYAYWMEELFSYARSLHPRANEIDLIGAARSASPMVYIKVIRNNPKVLNGVYGLSPMLPGDEDLLMEQLEVLRIKNAEDQRRDREAGRDNISTLDWDAINWSDDLARQTNWTEEKFRGHIMRFVTGANDLEMTGKERAFYREMETLVKTFSYIDVPGGEHNVISTGSTSSDPELKALAKKTGQFVYHDFLKWMFTNFPMK